MYHDASRAKRNAVGCRLERLVRPRVFGTVDRVHDLSNELGMRLGKCVVAFGVPPHLFCFHAEPEGTAVGESTTCAADLTAWRSTAA